MYIQSVPLFVYFPLYPSRRWNKNEFTWILLWWILTEWHAVVTYILVCCEICWQRRLNTKKRKMQICNRNKFNGRDPEQNYFDDSPKKGLHTTTFYLLFERIYSKLQRSLPFDVPCWSSPTPFWPYFCGIPLYAQSKIPNPILPVALPDFSNIMIIIIAYFTWLDPLAKTSINGCPRHPAVTSNNNKNYENNGTSLPSR